MNGPEIAIGSRGSPLALAQARLVREAFDQEGHRSRVVIIETDGDRRSVDTAWGEGAFVAAIERALQDGVVDVAVHSAKDVPTDEDPRLRIAAYLARADARDALVVRSDSPWRRLADLPRGTRVGTDSPRRTGFLLARRPDLAVHPLHGNVDTRLRRLDDGETDALVLACAGLDRLGLGDRIAERFEPEIVPPAPGQGAIAIQIRRGDARMVALAAAIDDRRTRVAVEAERAFLTASGGGCRAPIGALATVVGDDEMDLLGGYASPDGGRNAVARRRGPVLSREDLGRELATELDSGAVVRANTDRAELAGRQARPRRVLVTRAVDQSGELVTALRRAGLDPIEVPAIAIEYERPGGDLDAAAGLLRTYRWIVITSTNGARAILKAAERIPIELGAPSWAAIGSATRRVLEHEGIEIQFQPTQSSGTAMAAELPIVVGDRVLVVRGDLADGELALRLRARGVDVDDVIAYRTREAPERSRKRLAAAAIEGPIAAAVFTSGSTVRGLVSLGRAESIDVLSIPAICIGPETADEARSAGFQILAISPAPDSPALAATTTRALALTPQEIP
ncbi:MAG TPA: hydroxymethylbilane synthase [Candidatus Limnocylindrales bacterium]|nr:hydroxymethylbilane synthase [Candidatus Limnocylindrales bacterium]